MNIILTLLLIITLFYLSFYIYEFILITSKNPLFHDRKIEKILTGCLIIIAHCLIILMGDRHLKEHSIIFWCALVTFIIKICLVKEKPDKINQVIKQPITNETRLLQAKIKSDLLAQQIKDSIKS